MSFFFLLCLCGSLGTNQSLWRPVPWMSLGLSLYLLCRVWNNSKTSLVWLCSWRQSWEAEFNFVLDAIKCCILCRDVIHNQATQKVSERVGSVPNSILVLFYDEGASFLQREKRLHLKMVSKIPLGVLILAVIFALLREILRKKKPKTKQKSKTKITHTKQQQKPHNKQTNKKRSQKTYLELLTVLQISHWLFMETHVCLYIQAHEDNSYNSGSMPCHH